MRKPGRTGQVMMQLKSLILLKLGINIGFGEGMIMAEKQTNIFIPWRLWGALHKNGHVTLIYPYLINFLLFSISTTRKAMWKWNSSIISLIRYSFELGSLFSLHGFIISKLLTDGKYLQRTTRNTVLCKSNAKVIHWSLSFVFFQNFHKKVKIRNLKQQFFVGWVTVNDIT